MLAGIGLYFNLFYLKFFRKYFFTFYSFACYTGSRLNFLYVGATTLYHYQIHSEDQPKALALEFFFVTGFAAISIASSEKLHEIWMVKFKPTSNSYFYLRNNPDYP